MFLDRKYAGIKLAERLGAYKDRKDALVLALPRGGVVTGFEIARSLNLPLDLLIVRKIGFPGQPELAIGAVSETGVFFLNQRTISRYGISNKYVEDEIATQREEISRRVVFYRKGKSLSGLEGKTIILVDDGVATGSTIISAIRTLKKEKIGKLVLAIPVAPPDTADELKGMADEIICIETPSYFGAVGNHYHNFNQVSDEEVVKLLEGQGIGTVEDNMEELVQIPADSVILEGSLHLSGMAQAAVIFAHGSGSSRRSPRNKFVAKTLNKAGIGTLLFDLLTREEDTIYQNRFNIDLLTDRLKAATLWLKKQPQAERLKIGYFGSSTGSASALKAAIDLEDTISAIVSRGGRPDLAGNILHLVAAPTLLIVGGYDEVVIKLNKEAYELIKSKKELKIIPGATHLFEEPGKLEEVARLAKEWFKAHLLT